MNQYKFDDLSLKETDSLANKLSQMVSVDDTVCLYGDLGAGKTQFAKYLLSNIIADKKNDISSPTYNIVHTYDMDADKGEVGHFDLYRLQSEKELIELGFEEAIEHMLCVIEWPGIAEAYLPSDRIDVYIDFTDNEDLRNIRIESKKWLKL